VPWVINENIEILDWGLIWGWVLAFLDKVLHFLVLCGKVGKKSDRNFLK